MKAIILAGGSGTRLNPCTLAVTKQLLPVYNKPMIYYPLSTVMLAGIKEILIIVKKLDKPIFERLLGNGSQWNLNIEYAIQNEPKGIAEALIIGEEFLAGESCMLVLGDNFIYRDGLQALLKEAKENVDAAGAFVFAQHVKDPERFGVAEIDENDNVLSLEEKPKNPKSNLAVIGMYFYDKTAPQRAKALNPSKRGELEITDLNISYLQDNSLKLRQLGRGAAWLDMGTHEALLEAGQFVKVIEDHQGLSIANLDEIAKTY